eukprot:412213-Pelagomonas_calceolata.AAC.1
MDISTRAATSLHEAIITDTVSSGQAKDYKGVTTSLEFSKHSLGCVTRKGQSQPHNRLRVNSANSESTNLQQLLVAAHFGCDSMPC